MAIKVNVVFKGIEVSNAYISLAAVAIEPDKQAMSFNALYHAAQGEESFTGAAYSCTYDLEGGEPLISRRMRI